MKKILIITGVILAVGAVIFYLNNPISNKLDVDPTSTQTTSPKNISPTEVTLDVLQALDYYNLSTKSITNFDDITDLMTDLMNAKKYMQQGDAYVEWYIDNPDKFISTTALGMTKGSKTIQDSMENLIQYLRKIDENDPSTYSDINYQVSKYLSDNKDGFKMIAISAPQVTALFWDPANSENPTGPIPYKVSKEDRQRVLKKIDELFAEDLQEYYSSTDNYNSIIFAVDAIKSNIKPDTYEEAKN